MGIEAGHYMTAENRVTLGEGWQYWWESYDAIYFRKENSKSYVAIYKERRLDGSIDFKRCGIEEFRKIAAYYTSGTVQYVTSLFPLGGKNFRRAQIKNSKYQECQLYLCFSNGMISGFGCAGEYDDINQIVNILRKKGAESEAKKRAQEQERRSEWDRRRAERKALEEKKKKDTIRRKNAIFCAIIGILVVPVLIAVVIAVSRSAPNTSVGSVRSFERAVSTVNKYGKEKADLITSIKSPVKAGGTGRVQIHGSPGKTYTPMVVYDSGPSSADGLRTKTADKYGNVSWTWKIGTKTHSGEYTFTVSSDEYYDEAVFTIE